MFYEISLHWDLSDICLVIRLEKRVWGTKAPEVRVPFSLPAFTTRIILVDVGLDRVVAMPLGFFCLKFLFYFYLSVLFGNH